LQGVPDEPSGPRACCMSDDRLSSMRSRPDQSDDAAAGPNGRRWHARVDHDDIGL
jgi:hypothetical protein